MAYVTQSTMAFPLELMSLNVNLAGYMGLLAFLGFGLNRIVTGKENKSGQYKKDKLVDVLC